MSLFDLRIWISFETLMKFSGNEIMMTLFHSVGGRPIPHAKNLRMVLT